LQEQSKRGFVRHHEIAVGGGLMLLVGFLLLGYLLGPVTPLNILPIFLVGIGVIFTLLGLSTHNEPGVYPKAYVGYGVLAIVIGVVWFFLAIWTILIAAFSLAGALIVFGALFLLYSGTHLPTLRKKPKDK
jgi:hypothetical protein